MDEGEGRADVPCVEAVVEQGRGRSFWCEPVSVGFGDALKESMQAQSSQLIAHASRRNGCLRQPEPLRK